MYAKYAVKDNAFGRLLAWIWASTTTINMEAWDGLRFPTGNYPATLVKYTTSWDTTTPIIASEKILVVSRSTDTLTVTRWFDGDTPTSFDSWDYIYLNVVSAIIEDIQDEVSRLETDKLDISSFNSTLRNNLGNWKVIYTNWTGDETELALGTSWQFLKSNGATSAPTWEAPTVDINWLTNETTPLTTNHKLVSYNGITNVKRDAKASASNEWLVEALTDTEFHTGTDTTRYPNAVQVKNWSWFTLLAWWPLLYTNTSGASTTSSIYVLARTVSIKHSGTINMTVSWYTNGWWSWWIVEVRRWWTVLWTSSSFTDTWWTLTLSWLVVTWTYSLPDNLDIYIRNVSWSTTYLNVTNINAYHIPAWMSITTTL